MCYCNFIEKSSDSFSHGIITGGLGWLGDSLRREDACSNFMVLICTYIDIEIICFTIVRIPRFLRASYNVALALICYIFLTSLASHFPSTIKGTPARSCSMDQVKRRAMGHWAR